MITIIGTETPVAGLQCNILTTAPKPVLAPELVNRKLACGAITGGWKCLIYGTDATLFSGKCLVVSGVVSSITGVIASDPHGIGVTVTIRRISQPTIPSVTVK